jgi:hypothetical protein
MRYLLTTAFLVMASLISAQTDCPCCSKHHQAFNFWAGEWIVKDTSGSTVGLNSISIIENGCVLREKWTGKTGSTGTSLNYFDAADSTWNQLWIDNAGSILKLKGNLEEDHMVLRSEIQEDDELGEYQNQISWTPNDDGTVSQKWVVINADGKAIKTIFYGIYHKRE